MAPVKQTIRDVDVRGKRVIVRAGLDVPFYKDGSIGDDTRIRQVLPTLEYLLERSAAVVVVAHAGRPGGVSNELFSLKRVADCLEELLPDYSVVFDPSVSRPSLRPGPGELLLLENARFDSREKVKPDLSLVHEWAELADLYVDDAFNNAHRDHMSMTGFKGLLPSVMGLAFEHEHTSLSAVMQMPKQPLCVVMGGVKFETRIPMIENFIERVGADSILFGSALAHVFLAAQSRGVGAFPVDVEHVAIAREMLGKFGSKLVLPQDVIVSPSIENTIDVFEIDLQHDEIPTNMTAVDIGPKARSSFASRIAEAGSVIWNGPMGAFETPAFAEGTRAVAEAMASSGATTVVGGGDTGSAVKSFDLVDNMSFVSTAGGASLALFEGQTLPAYAALDDRADA